MYKHDLALNISLGLICHKTQPKHTHTHTHTYTHTHRHWYHHHHHDVRLARISLTLSLHVSLSFIAFGRSSSLHPVSSHSCCMNVRAGCPAFDWPYAGVHRSTSLTILSLLLQQCSACLVRLACIVFLIGGRWPYSWRRVGCCCQDLGSRWLSKHVRLKTTDCLLFKYSRMTSKMIESASASMGYSLQHLDLVIR